MKINTVIFNPDEKQVLLHSLFEDDQELQGIMKKIISDFEAANLDKLIEANHEELSIIELIRTNKEKALPQLANFYEDLYELKKSPKRRRRIEAGIFYTVCKIMLVRCDYRTGLNKLMRAATFADLPSKFIPLYLFRLSSIYIEQGKILEAEDFLKLAYERCRLYAQDSTMSKLELLIFYQSARVGIIQGDLIGAKRFIDNIRRELKKENIIFSYLLGYYHRWAGEIQESYDVLGEAYREYKSRENVKNTYARSWFNVLYQLAICLLEEKAPESPYTPKELIEEARFLTGKFNYRNLGYCENVLGRIAMKEQKWEKALEHFLKAYAFFEKYTDYRNMARTKRNQGSVFIKLKKYADASHCFNHSLDYDHHTQINIGIILTLLQKIDLRIELVQYYRAREYLDRIDQIKLLHNHFLLKEIENRQNLLDEITLPEGILGESKRIMEIRREVDSYSQISQPVLIAGEGGTGKSFIAWKIHDRSKREGSFNTVSCQTISPSNLDCELFGDQNKNSKIPGLLEKTDQGTLLIKDIDNLPVPVQLKFIRFLDEKKIHSAENGQEKEVDVKIIFTYPNNIQERVASGDFIKDFVKKISDFMIKLPLLRERREDIKKLAEYFYIEESRNLNKKICGIQTCAMNLLEDYPWPGNIRELQKTIRQCVVKLENGQPVAKEQVLDVLDYSIIKQSVRREKNVNSETIQEASTQTENEEIIKRLKSLEKKLVKDQQEPTRTRTSDSYSIINAVFKIIQEQGPVRKSEVVAACPDAEKSFHHWISILKEKRGVITVEASGNFKVYSPVSKNILNKKLKTGELSRTDNLFTVVE